MVDVDGRAVPKVSLVNAINVSKREISTNQILVPLPPVFRQIEPPVPPIVKTNPRTAGQSF